MSLKKLTRPCLALALAAAASPLAAQIGTSGGYSKGVGTFPNFAIYKPSEVAPVDLADSPRIDRLVRDGRLYVSLADAIALALENNLDIAVARFTPLQADVDILRTRGGGIAQSAQTVQFHDIVSSCTQDMVSTQPWAKVGRRSPPDALSETGNERI